MTEYKRYTFNLYPSDIDALKLIVEHGEAENVTQALRSAIATESYMRAKSRSGAVIKIHELDGSSSEIHFNHQ